jgi:polysaccharide export outer membrane protein
MTKQLHTSQNTCSSKCHLWSDFGKGFDNKSLKKRPLLAIRLLFRGGEDKPRNTMRSHNPIRLLAILAVLGLSGSVTQAQSVTASASNAVRPSNDDHSGAAPSADAPALGGTSQFTLGSADVIRVNVWKNADLSQTVTVGPDGFVSLPLLGDLHVAGMTASQLSQDLTSRLSTYIVTAQVTVSVVDIRSRQVYVMGQVGKAGGYPLIAPMTILQLIAQAGGLSIYANRKGIIILRATNGVSQKLSFNYTNAIHGDGKQNISLQPGDTVIVP